MKKLLLFAVIPLFISCGTQENVVIKSREPVYRKQVLQGQISMQDYFYLIDGEKELNEMKGSKK